MGGLDFLAGLKMQSRYPFLMCTSLGTRRQYVSRSAVSSLHSDVQTLQSPCFPVSLSRLWEQSCLLHSSNSPAAHSHPAWVCSHTSTPLASLFCALVPCSLLCPGDLRAPLEMMSCKSGKFEDLPQFLVYLISNFRHPRSQE